MYSRFVFVNVAESLFFLRLLAIIAPCAIVGQAAFLFFGSALLSVFTYRVAVVGEWLPSACVSAGSFRIGLNVSDRLGSCLQA